jgi:hypothetical protein
MPLRDVGLCQLSCWDFVLLLLFSAFVVVVVVGVVVGVGVGATFTR